MKPVKIAMMGMTHGHTRNHKTPLINLKWHKQTIQAMLGCYESIQTGKIARVV